MNLRTLLFLFEIEPKVLVAVPLGYLIVPALLYYTSPESSLAIIRTAGLILILLGIRSILCAEK
jgi:hypothetical protein